MWTMQRGGGCAVGNGLDKERVAVVVDGVDKMPTSDVPTPDTNKDNKSTKPTTRTLQQLQPECEPTNVMAMAVTKWAKHHSYAGTPIIAPLANRDPAR